MGLGAGLVKAVTPWDGHYLANGRSAFKSQSSELCVLGKHVIFLSPFNHL